MAAYNGEQFIQEQIDSILNQQDVDVDIYVRLDPSSDGTELLLRNISKANSNIFLLYAKEPSGSAGQNFLRLILDVDFSNYDYIAFADQDDVWFKSKLIRAISCIEEHNVDAYSANVTAWWGDGTEKLVFKSSPQQQYDYLFESPGPGCTFVFRPDFANKVKNFLYSIGEDVELIWLHDWFCYAFARSRDFSWFIDETSMMRYRQHEGNSVGANSGMPALKTRIKEVLNGEAFDKAILQANILGISDIMPIKLLLEPKCYSPIKVALMANKCRRKRIDQLFFAIAMVIYSLKGS